MLLKEKKDTVHWVHWASLFREMFAWDTGQLDSSVIIIKKLRMQRLTSQKEVLQKGV